MEPSRQREAIALVRRGAGTIGESDVGARVLLQAWVRRRRDHGGVIFLDLRDRSGTVQVVVRLTLTLMRDIDGRVVGTRRFERTVGAASDGAPDVVSAFNVAMSGLLQEATGWIVAAMSGAGV